VHLNALLCCRDAAVSVCLYVVLKPQRLSGTTYKQTFVCSVLRARKERRQWKALLLLTFVTGSTPPIDLWNRKHFSYWIVKQEALLLLTCAKEASLSTQQKAFLVLNEEKGASLCTRGGSWSLGPKGPTQWSGQKSSSNFGTEFPHYRLPRPNQGLFSSQNKTEGLPLWCHIILCVEKQIWWRLVFHLFGTPFVDFLSREMGQNGVSDQLLGRFTPSLLQWYLFIKKTPFK